MNPNDFQRHLANPPRRVAQGIFNGEDSLDITSFRPILVVAPETTQGNPSHSPESSFMCSPVPPSQSVQDPNDGLTQNVLPINHTVQKEFEGSLWYFRPLQHRIFPRYGTMSGDSKPQSKIVRGEIVLSNDPSSTKFFTTYHLCKRSKHELLMVPPNNKLALYEVIRNQAMLALAVGTGPPLFDELRTLCWSDLTLHNVVLPGSILKQVALALKPRQELYSPDGKLITPVVFRHSWAEACAMGAVGFYFYSYFHILTKERPIFFPDAFDRAPYGRGDWHKMSLFPGQAEGEKPLTKTNFDSVLNTYCTGVAGPHSLANQEDTITRWELYNQKRHLLNPPSVLLEYLFPWVDQEISNCCERMGKYGEKAMDDSLLGFLGLLKYLRLIIVQDATILFLKYPDNPIFTKPPFSFSSFRRFAEASKASMSHPHSQTLMQPTDLTKERSSSISSITEGMLDILEAVDKDAKCVRPLLAQLSAAGSPLDGKRISRGKNTSRRFSDYEDIRSPFTTPLFANS